jgi:hypothetical protein
VLKTSHLLHLCRYIHGNPVKDELVADPANPKRCKKRPGPVSDIVLLSVLVQQIGLKRSYSNPFCTHIQHQWHSAAENSINTARNIGQNWYEKGYNLRKHATITKH